MESFALGTFGREVPDRGLDSPHVRASSARSSFGKSKTPERSPGGLVLLEPVPLTGITCRLASSIPVSTTKQKAPQSRGFFIWAQINEASGSSRFWRVTPWLASDWR